MVGPDSIFLESNRNGGSSTWEVPPGSSELMQVLTLNPDSNLPSSVKMNLPLPGPVLDGLPFPQESYFEITILHVKSLERENGKREHWYTRASKRVKESSKDDKTKLIDDDSGNNWIRELNIVTKEELEEASHNKNKSRNKKRQMVMGLGLSVGIERERPDLPGTYPGSIGFHSDGSVYLDGMKLVFESDKSAWTGLDRVIGCGFDPTKKKVYFTVDSTPIHSINCKSNTYSTPLYPTLASHTESTFLINLGQAKFRYSPANKNRTTNPSFVRSSSRASSTASTDFEEDSGDLFSMGRVDSDWLDHSRRGGKRSKSVGGNWIDGGAVAVDIDGYSDLFEIPLKD